MRHLLLGGAGFIGTHLAKKLIEEGEEVTIVDSLSTSKLPDYKVNFIEGDIQSMELNELFSSTDIIYYLAGSVGVEYIDKNPSSTLFNNISLMNKLVPLFEKHQKKVIFSSTSEVYGEGPFSEDNNLSIGPPSKLRWGYACAKLMTEFMIKACTFPSVIVRFFNVVGPGQSAEYGMVLPRFIEAAKTGNNLIVYGDGEQIRSFCHIKDAVEALLLLRKAEGIFNIGNDTPTSIGELANLVLRLVKTTSVVQHVPYERDFSNQHGDIYKRIPNISKIRDLGYNTEYDLNNIIEDMI
jgi:UDP-glucose 4-epimerase